MKIQLSLLATLLLAVSSLLAKPVDPHTAKIVGQNFLRYKTTSGATLNDIPLSLIYTSASKLNKPSMAETVACFYVFNFSTGFVIVAADDVVRPILGYSYEKSFRTENMAEAVAKWLEGYKSQIRYAIMHDLQPDQEIINAWRELKGGNLDFVEPSNRSSMPALMQTQWDQPAPYNELCPGGSVTGCVATAMAQIMKYWNYPEKGQGFHSFNHENFGTVSANFGSTTYQWGNMPNSIVNSNNAIATLMYHCGVSVDMGYTPEVSGAWVIENSPTPEACSEYAFKTYFGYDNTLQGIERVNYSDTQWETVLKTELDASRPVMYDGFGNGGGHAFVCDGYDTNDFFHFNWGWSGYYDGYFETSALNPGGTGTGGGTGGYNSGQQAIIGIKPPGGGTSTTYTLNLYDNLYASSTNLFYGQGFSIATNIWNTGASDFTGDYAAVVFDYDYNFVEFMEIKTNWSLDAGFVYTEGISFSTDGLLSMLPGTYYVAVFFRPTGGEWSIVGDGDYFNLIQMDVSNANAIELYSAMSISPGTTLTQGSPASVNLNILNNGIFTFQGTYSVDLYDLNGDWIENIGQFTESNGLPAGYLYLEPYLTFATSAVEADPGTYLVAVTHQWSGNSWELTGSSYFQNPLYVTVKAPALVPDIYENNNTVQQSYTLPISFSGNTAIRNTAGSDAHTGSDYDFYKIELPAGFDYSITARLHDSYNSGNGNQYTLDGQFSFSFDGNTWSDAFDDILPGNIQVPDGGTVYFFATPYFLGQTGTYLLDMLITRSPLTATKDEIAEENIGVYPNPASSVITVDLQHADIDFDKIELVNLLGQVIYKANIQGQLVARIDVGEITDGVYNLRLLSNEGIVSRSVTISR